MGNAQKTEKELVQELRAVYQRLTELESTKEALRESEEKFASIFRYSPMGLSLTRLRDGVITEINDSYTIYTGYARDEVIGRKVSEINIWVNPADRERMLKMIKDKGRVTNEEFYFHVKSGEIHPVLVSAENVNIGGEDCLLVMALDITERKQAEEALQESEEKFRNLFEHAKDAVILADAETGLLVDVNPAGCAMLGLPKEKIIGMHQAALHPPEMAEKYQQIFREHVEKKVVPSDETILLRADGTPIQVDMSASVITLGNKTIIQGVFRDITERKQAEEELRESEEFTSSLLTNTPNPIIVITPDSAIKYVNPAFEKLTDFTLTDIIGMKTPYPWWPQETKEEIDAVLKQVTLDDGLKTEMAYQKKSGEHFWVELNATSINKNGEQKYTLVNWVNITERKQAEIALKESEEKFSKAFNAASDAMCILSSNGGFFLAVNDSYVKISGYSRDELIGHNPDELKMWVNPEDRVKSLTSIKEKGRLAQEEFAFRTKSGKIRTCLFSAEPINVGEERHMITVIQDITERKKAEEELRESEEFTSTLLTNTSNAIFVTYPDGTIKYVNPAFETLTGFSLAEIIGMKIPYPWWPKDNKDEIEASLMETTSCEGINLGERLAKQMTFQKKNGELFTVDLNATIINKNGKREYILVTWIDITERKKAEEALQESEEKFSKVFNASANAICITSLANHKFIEANESFSRFTGYPREEIIGHATSELKLWVKPEEQQRWKDVLQKEGRVFNQEFSSRMKSGEIRIGLGSDEVINIGGKPCRFMVITDITEVKQAEKALQESEEKFSKVFHANVNPMCIITVEGLNFIDINESFIRFSGYTREEIIGYSSFKIGLWVNKDDPITMAKIFNEKGRLYNVEFDSRTKSGEIRTGLFSGEIITILDKSCIIIVITDITERKKAEEALRESEEKFAKAFSASANAICITSLKDNRFMEINDSFSRFTGYSHQEVIGHDASELKLWVKPEELKRWMDTLQKEGRVFNQEFGSRRKSGEIRIGLASAEVINIRGEPRRIVVITDITERKKAEEGLKQAMANLEQSSARLAATNKELEAFSYSVSHDLRSPLRSIDGFSQALLEDYPDKLDATGQDYLKRLRNASQKMGELIDGLLKLSRLTRSEIHRENVDLSALADEIATRLRETNPERKAEFIIGGGLTANGDPQLLRALLENLLGNAWKFTGKLPMAKIEFGAIQNSVPKTFFVKDNGAGFDMTYVDKLFGAFQRLHDITEFPGTGIGLATVQRIINRHGGTVRAEGEVGKGAAFYFTLD